MNDRFDLFERKYAMFILNELGKQEGLSKTELKKKGSEEDRRTKLSRINEMIEAGLIRVDRGNHQYNVSKLYLTPEGRKIANILLILEGEIPDVVVDRKY